MFCSTSILLPDAHLLTASSAAGTTAAVTQARHDPERRHERGPDAAGGGNSTDDDESDDEVGNFFDHFSRISHAFLSAITSPSPYAMCCPTWCPYSSGACNPMACLMHVCRPPTTSPRSRLRSELSAAASSVQPLSPAGMMDPDPDLGSRPRRRNPSRGQEQAPPRTRWRACRPRSRCFGHSSTTVRW